MVQGLITKERKNLDPSAAPFARSPEEANGLKEGANIVEVVNAFCAIRTNKHCLICARL